MPRTTTYATTDGNIEFLLLCLESLDGQVKWDEVAVKAGRFKKGAYAKQFYQRMKDQWRDKIPGIDLPPSNTPKTSEGGRKRGAEADDDGDATSSKGKKSKTKHAPLEDGNEAANTEANNVKQQKSTFVTPPADRPEYVNIRDEEAWDRAVKRAASRSREGSVFDGSYGGASEPFQYFDAKDNQMKTFDPIADDIEDL